MLNQIAQCYYNGCNISPLFVVNSENFIFVQTHFFSRIMWKPDTGDLKYYNVEVQSALKTAYIHICRLYKIPVTLKSSLETLYRAEPKHSTNALNTPQFLNELATTLLYNHKAYTKPLSTNFYDAVTTLINSPLQKTIISKNLNVYTNLKLCFNDTCLVSPYDVVNRVLKTSTPLFTYDSNTCDMVLVDKCKEYTKLTAQLSNTNDNRTKNIIKNKDLLKFVFIKVNDTFISVYSLCRNADKAIVLPIPKVINNESTISESVIDKFLNIQKNLNELYMFNPDSESCMKLNMVRITVNSNTNAVIEVTGGKLSNVWFPITEVSLVKITQHT